MGILAALGGIKSPILIKKANFDPLKSQNIREQLSNRVHNVQYKNFLETGQNNMFSKGAKSKGDLIKPVFYNNNTGPSTISRGSAMKLPSMSFPFIILGLESLKTDAKKLQKFRLAMEDLKSSYEPPSLSSKRTKVLKKFIGDENFSINPRKAKNKKKSSKSIGYHHNCIDSGSKPDTIKLHKVRESSPANKEEWVNPTERMKIAVAAYKDEIIKNRKPLEESLSITEESQTSEGE